MLTKEKLMKAMRQTGHRLISSDGWMDVTSCLVIGETVDDSLSPHMIESKLSVTFETTVIYDPEMKKHLDAHFDLARATLADSIYRELYGDIMPELSVMKSMIRYGDREGSLKILEALMKKLEG